MPRTTHERRAGTLTELAVPPPAASLPGTHRAYSTASGCHVIVGHEPVQVAPQHIWLPPNVTLVWHVSVSHPRRYPGWDEIADVRYKLVPNDVTMALLLPPPDDYVNDHDRCFHLWQVDDRLA
jgi:hypothetical protein